MNLSAPVKTLATLLVVAFLLPIAPMLHAQTRLPPDGHLRLIVHNGTGNGDSYYVGQTVPVGAQTPSGFEFVKWFKTEGDGSLSAPLQADGNFIMGSDNSEIAATFAKLESWFPPGPEGNTKGLLLPKPQSGQARRLEQRLRVTLNRGSSARPPYSEVWGALRVKMKWKEATYVRFFTAETGGQEIANEDVLPKDSFKPKAENVYEASIWYEGNLTQEQIAQMSQSGNTPKVTIQMNFVVEGNDKPTSATASLLPIEIKVNSANSPSTSAPKYTDAPKKGNADNLFSVWQGEDFTVRVKLPESFQLPPSLIKWSVPGENIPDNSKEHTFNWTSAGTKRIEVKVAESKFELWVDVPHAGDVGQIQAIATMPPWATAQIGSWGFFAQDYCNTNYPETPKRDAIRHSYWCALSVSDGYVTQDQVLYFTTAHEYDDKWIDKEQSFNTTMDLWNNLAGSAVDISIPALPPTPNTPLILRTLEEKYSAGELWIFDGSNSQGASEGIILKSDGTKIHPVN